MSYIKVKDGVYKVSHYNDWATHKRKGATLIDGDKTSYIKNEDIIAQSENLEELCDEFVYDYGKDKDRFKNDSLALKILKANNNSKVNIYGCIWTDKGLIYVAKMDDKGELELI